MLKKMMLGLAIFGISIASAKTYHVTLLDSYKVGSQTLKPGDYDIAVKGSTAVLADQDHHLQINGTTENETRKFENTAILSQNEAGKPRITAIQLGGSRLEVHFN